VIPNYNGHSHVSLQFTQLSITKMINRPLINKNTVTFFIVFPVASVGTSEIRQAGCFRNESMIINMIIIITINMDQS